MAGLFGQGGNGRREPKSLVEFRAGKMTLSGTTVTADARKGLVYMKLMEDQLLHFYWKDRNTGEVVDDLIIFSGDAEMKRVPQCTTGRVFLLKFHDVGRNYFYWLQEPKEDKDEEYLKKVNELIENPQAAASESMSGFPPGLLAPHLQSLFGPNASPQLMEQLINSGALPSMFQQLEGSRGGRGTSSSVAPVTASAPPTSSSSSQSQQTPARPQQQQSPAAASQSRQLLLGDLQNILSSMTIPGAEQEGGGATERGVQLSDVVTPDVLRPLANTPGVEEQISPLLPPTSEGAEAILTSPQFQQALGVFGSALGSGQLGPLMNQFGLGQSVSQAANSGDFQQFARALQSEMSPAETDQSEESAAADKDGGDDKEDSDKQEKPDPDPSN